MIVIGDIEIVDDKNPPQDPWNERIAVFDMTVLEFANSYSVNAELYEPPYAIQQYYNNR